ncbi:MAG: FecR family protein [Bacteroidales bacterium]
MGENIEKIIRTFIGSDFSEQASASFHSWLLDDGHKKGKVRVLRKLWDETDAKADESTDTSYRQVLKKIKEQQQTSLKAHRLSILRYIAAAVILIAVSVGGTFWLMQGQTNSQLDVKMVECYAKNGDTDILSLPDGSTVHLNSGSYIIYPDNMEGNTRTIFLIGEAHFDVAKNLEKPFIVKSSNLSVTALGTKFNVKAYPEDECITATLIEGKVSVDCHGRNYILTAGQEVIFNRNSDESQQLDANVDITTAWQRDETIFNKSTFEEILNTLEHRYGVEFRSPKMKYNEDRYNFVFKEGADINEVMNVVQTVVGRFKYRIDGNICYLYWD